MAARAAILDACSDVAETCQVMRRDDLVDVLAKLDVAKGRAEELLRNFLAASSCVPLEEFLDWLVVEEVQIPAPEAGESAQRQLGWPEPPEDDPGDRPSEADQAEQMAAAMAKADAARQQRHQQMQAALVGAEEMLGRPDMFGDEESDGEQQQVVEPNKKFRVAARVVMSANRFLLAANGGFERPDPLLVTLHFGEREADGLAPVEVTNIGGEAVVSVRAELEKPTEVLHAILRVALQDELGPWTMQEALGPQQPLALMLPCGRALPGPLDWQGKKEWSLTDVLATAEQVHGCRQLVEQEQQIELERGVSLAAEGGETMLRLHVCGLIGNDLGTFAVSGTDTVADLLKKLSLDIPEGKVLTCVHGSQTLAPTSVLSRSDVTTGATLTVVMVDEEQKAAGKLQSFWKNRPPKGS